MVLQRQPIQKLHDDEALLALLDNVVNRADVGMIQCRGGFRFTPETGQCLRVFGYFVWQELEGNKPAELHILSLIDDAHPAAAQLFDDAVVA